MYEMVCYVLWTQAQMRTKVLNLILAYSCRAWDTHPLQRQQESRSVLMICMGQAIVTSQENLRILESS